MQISIHQPNYFPWLGYFYKIINSDIFVFLDNVQYSKGSYTNRTKLSINDSIKWITLPIKYKFGTNINNIEVLNNKWKLEHLNKLHFYYSKSKFYKEIWPLANSIYMNNKEIKLSEINIFFIKKIIEYFEINVKLYKSSEILIKTNLYGDDRLIELIKNISGVDTYISGNGALDYQSEEKFNLHNIKVKYTPKAFSSYNQQGNINFIPGLSILDCLFNIGKKDTLKLLQEK
mgnify:CR=1 FL=1